MTAIFPVLDEIHKRVANRETIITDANSPRKGRSLHPVGNAIDIRSRDLQKGTVLRLVSSIRKTLGNCFDVLLESDHIHIEYDRKNGRCGSDMDTSFSTYNVSNTRIFLDNLRGTPSVLSELVTRVLTHRFTLTTDHPIFKAMSYFSDEMVEIDLTGRYKYVRNSPYELHIMLEYRYPVGAWEELDNGDAIRQMKRAWVEDYRVLIESYVKYHPEESEVFDCGRN